jgi:hypothetical protein
MDDDSADYFGQIENLRFADSLGLKFLQSFEKFAQILGLHTLGQFQGLGRKDPPIGFSALILRRTIGIE